jgi:hypothetical protein
MKLGVSMMPGLVTCPPQPATIFLVRIQTRNWRGTSENQRGKEHIYDLHSFNRRKCHERIHDILKSDKHVMLTF